MSERHKYPIELFIFSILNDNSKGSDYSQSRVAIEYTGDYSEDQARKKTLDQRKAKVQAKYCAKWGVYCLHYNWTSIWIIIVFLKIVVGVSGIPYVSGAWNVARAGA